MLSAANAAVPKSGNGNLYLSPLYLPFASPTLPPTSELQHHMRNSGKTDKEILNGCNSIWHHITWGSTNFKKRGDALHITILFRPLFISTFLRQSNLRIEATRSFCADQGLTSICQYIYDFFCFFPSEANLLRIVLITAVIEENPGQKLGHV